VPAVHFRAEARGWEKRTGQGRNAKWDWEENKGENIGDILGSIIFSL